MTDVLSYPWLEAALVVPVLGAVLVGRVRDAYRAAFWAVAFAAGTFACSLLAGFAVAAGAFPAGHPWDIQLRLFGARPFALDELTGAILPTVALLHLLTAAATPRRNMRRFSFTWALAAVAITLATLASADRRVLVALLAIGTLPPLVELWTWGKPVRVYLLHMSLFVGLLAAGLLLSASEPGLAAGLLLAAVLVRAGTMPAHCWVTDWFEHASFGRALLFVAPLTGAYAAIRLVLPVAPEWVLQPFGAVSLVTAVYAAGMAAVQPEARRFFAFLFISHAALVLTGPELDTRTSLTGALSLWSSVILSLGGLGLTLGALEARVGRLSLARFHGLYEHSPALAVCFLLTGLASVGFPGTAGFVAAEMLVNGAIGSNPWVGLAVVTAAALNGIAVVRAYFLLFTGARHGATVPLGITWRERVAVLTLAALLIGGGLVPQPGIASADRAAGQLVRERAAHMNGTSPAR